MMRIIESNILRAPFLGKKYTVLHLLETEKQIKKDRYAWNVLWQNFLRLPQIGLLLIVTPTPPNFMQFYLNYMAMAFFPLLFYLFSNNLYMYLNNLISLKYTG